MDIAVHGNYAYVADRNDGLKVIDISNENSPEHKATIDTVTAIGVGVSGSFAYVVDWINLNVVDISDPPNVNNDSIKRTCAVPNGDQVEVGDRVGGKQYAYVKRGFNSLAVVDISDPMNVDDNSLVSTLLASVMGVNRIFDIRAQGNYLYVAGDLGYILDISDPENINDSINLGTGIPFGDGIYSYGDFLYGFVYGHGTYSLTIYHCSLPNLPTEVVSVDTLNGAENVAVRGRYVYVADYSGLSIYRIDNQDSLTLTPVGSYTDGGSASCITVHGDCAFLGTWSHGVVIIDISVPENVDNSSKLGAFDLSAYDVKVRGDHAYLACNQNGFYMVDISDFNNPIIEDAILYGDDCRMVSLSDDYAYIAAADYGAIAVNIDRESSGYFTEEGRFLNIYWVNAVSLKNPYVYVADGLEGLKIVDIFTSDPTIQLINSLDTHDASDIDIFGHYAFIADGSEGIKIIDISHPESQQNPLDPPSGPVLIGTCDTNDARGIAVSGSYAFIADFNSLKMIALLPE
jgi:hypothetical protein